MKVTIIGGGNMGSGIGTRVVAGDNELELIDHNPDDARALADEIGGAPAETPSGELVVLALPYDAVAGAIDQHKDALAGKVVVDITNPADWSTMDRVVT